MDLQDFKYNYKYKIIIPSLYVVSWIAMFLGPLWFQILYQKLCIFMLIYLTFKSSIVFLISIITFCKSRRVIKKAEQIQKQLELQESLTHEFNPEVYHAFIIPNYKEDQELLAQTLQKIAEHQGSKQRYLVYLAMEGHEQNSDIKAHNLIQQFQGRFLQIGYTLHSIRQYEQKGKASNVSWCVEHIQQLYFDKLTVSPDKIILTIIDADSWVPEVYIREIDDHLCTPQRLEKRQYFIYQSNQIFTRNQLDVPIFNRVYDQIHGSMHSNNTFSIFSVTYPLSNYSLHYSLAKKIGWWDTCADAIGEDFHMTQKAFWKTEGKVEAVPIFAPFNQLSLQTGKGYIADIKARFWQAERHARGVSDVPYNINMLIKRPFRWRTFVAAFHVIQNYMLPALIPWALTAMTYEYNFLFKYSNHSPLLISQKYFSPLYTYNTIFLYTAFFFYWIQKRIATKTLYNLKNESVLRILQYYVLFFPVLTILSIPSYIVAAFGALFDGREYIVADKVVNRHEHAK